MCKITKGKLYKGIHNNIIIKATTSSSNGELFRAILIEDKNGEFNSKLYITLNKESGGWNPYAFKLFVNKVIPLKDYPTTKHKTNNELFPIY